MFVFRRKRHSHTSRIFIKDMTVEMAIGVFDNEKNRRQRVRINIDATPAVWPDPDKDMISETVSYDDIVKIIQRHANGPHIHLVETLAERIARDCLRETDLQEITVRTEKLDIYAFAVPGVEITRRK